MTTIWRTAPRRATWREITWSDMSDNLDPTWVRAQPALRSARRRMWLIPGAVLAAVAVVVLAIDAQLNLFVSVLGIALVVAAYISMVVVAVRVRGVAERNRSLAWLLIWMAFVAVAAVITQLVLATSPTS